MKILSVDWDYFFPDATGYDWGFCESPFFIEFLWPTRLNDQDMFTGAPCLETYIPTVPVDFWNIVTNRPKTLFITESHCHMFGFGDRKNDITCLDAHHDFGYNSDDLSLKQIHAGNWALALYAKNKLSKFSLHYPEYRRKRREKIPPKGITKISYKLPKPQSYDAIHICRSGSWTPPWYDDVFGKLVDSCPAGESSKVKLSELKQRSMTLKEAFQKRESIRAAYKLMKGEKHE